MTKRNNAAEEFANRLRETGETVEVHVGELDGQFMMRDGTKLTEQRADELTARAMSEVESKGLRPERKSLSG